MASKRQMPPAVTVAPEKDAPTKKISSSQLVQLGMNLDKTFKQYADDRQLAEQKWLRNLRQYLGIYDPDVEKQLSVNRSKAYPRLTRVKCISVLSRIMSLMFPGNERNWELRASPSADMKPDDVMEAIKKMQAADEAAGVKRAVDLEYVHGATQALAEERAALLSTTIDDQLQELGGDQTNDYVTLNRRVAKSGIEYGIGLLRGPFVRTQKRSEWKLGDNGMPEVTTKEVYKPQFEFLPVWDFYPDMSAKTLQSMDGYFIRLVMTRSQLRALANREDFFKSQITDYLKMNTVGNYKAQTFETELRTMGVKSNVNDQKADATKYEVICWHGPIGAEQLILAGVEIPEEKRAEEIEAEVWMIGGTVIKADINQWHKLGIDVRTIHPFLFDEDDTSPVGNGLPNIVRDSAMSVAAATRMLLDNASVVCGPNIEVNTDLMRPDQDLSSIAAYKVWYREGLGTDAQFPAIRSVDIDGHMSELLQIVELFMKFADMETFVGPQTGGDMERGPSEPMRTAAGASMLRGDAALPFKDIIRNFDSFTQSVISSLVSFNKKFNPENAPAGDFDVIARGATSLIAKEVRGMQLDQLAATLRPNDEDHIDDRKLIEQRFAVRDLQSMLVSPDEAKRRAAGRAQQAQELADQQRQLTEANIRKILTDAFKNVAQGQKNTAGADAVTVNAALKVLEQGMVPNETGSENGSTSQAN